MKKKIPAAIYRAVIYCPAFIICLFWVTNGHAQSILNPTNLSEPFIPGDRALTFTVSSSDPNPSDVEVWVFYSKVESDLATLNSSSFGSTKHYGRAVTVKDGSTLDCHFVFPHPFHAATPNADLFAAMRGVAGLVTSGFPTPTIINDVLIPGSSASAIKVDFNPLQSSKGDCIFYRVYKRTKSGSGYIDEISETNNFKMPDTFNIGIAGDSYGAGEGAPNDTYQLGEDDNAIWLSCKCHRSKRSGLLRGVKKFISNFPEVAVDYSFQACSGSKTDEFYQVEQTTNQHPPATALYTGDCGGGKNAIQFQTIRNDLIVNRKHDAIQMLLMSGGGNNTGFGDVVETYLIGPLNLAVLQAAANLINADLLDEYTQKINNLQKDYASLDQGVNNFFTEVRPIIGITTYPDPTKGLFGRCGCTSPGSPSYPCALYETDFNYSPQAEYELLHTRFIVPLNNQVRKTTQLGWNVIDVESAAGNKGLCNCDEAYVNTIGAAYRTQGDIFGVVHPNDEGYENMYREPVFSFVSSKYNEYKSGYALAVLIGAIPGPSNCQTLDVNSSLLAAVNRLRDISSVVSNIPGLATLPTDLNNAVQQNTTTVSSKSQALNPNLTLIQHNTQYVNAFNSLVVKGAIVKPVLPTRTLTPVLPFGPAFTKMKNEFNNYIISPDFQKKLSGIKQQNIIVKKINEPLDNLFNN